MVQNDNDEALREVEAMTTVARALATLDQLARQRVVRWAAEKFHLEASTSTPVVAMGAPLVEQEACAEGSYDFTSRLAAAEQVRGTEPLDALLRELAADFQRLALESHGA